MSRKYSLSTIPPGRVLNLHRDCDESMAIQVGLSASQGDLVALLPSYLQCDPADFGAMAAEIDEGADYVASWRSPRIDTRRDAFSSSFFNTLTRKLTGVPLHDINSGLRLMKREVAESVPIYGDLHRFLPVSRLDAGISGHRSQDAAFESTNQRGFRRVRASGVGFADAVFPAEVQSEAASVLWSDRNYDAVWRDCLDWRCDRATFLWGGIVGPASLSAWHIAGCTRRPALFIRSTRRINHFHARKKAAELSCGQDTREPARISGC